MKHLIWGPRQAYFWKSADGACDMMARQAILRMARMRLMPVGQQRANGAKASAAAPDGTLTVGIFRRRFARRRRSRPIAVLRLRT
jgi:hypothetical protein